MKVRAALLTLALAPAAAFAENAMIRFASGDTAADPAPAPSAGVAAPAIAPAPAPAPAPSAPAPVATASVAAVTPEALAAQTGLKIGASLDESVGTGTFVNPAYYANIVTYVSVAPKYTFKLRDISLAVNALALLTYEHSLPQNENARRFDWWDPRFGLSAPALYKNQLTGISVSPSIGIVLPATYASITSSMIFSGSAGLSFARSIGNFDLSLATSVGHGFYTNQVNALPNNGGRDPQGNLLCVSRTEDAYCASNGLNPAVTGTVGLSANWRINDKLSASAGFSLIKSWKYAVTYDPNDPLNGQALDSNGNPAAHVGMGQSDKMRGSAALTYSLSDTFDVSLSTLTIQTPLTKDNQHVRFPFWDFIGPADNNTSVSVGMSALF